MSLQAIARVNIGPGRPDSALAYLQRLEAAGRVIFVGRCENGDWGPAVSEAEDEAAARAVAESDPAVSSGLMRMQFHAFRVVMQQRAGAVGSPAGAG